ncbi:MAG: hypothetical protein ACRD01_02115 [Terriglobales bacterium]
MRLCKRQGHTLLSTLYVHAVFALIALAVAGPALRAQVRDPLTAAEANQVRDTADKLDKRVPLLLSFAQLRLTRFEQVRTAAPPAPDRDNELYDLLRQYHAILPELDDAVDDLVAAGPKQYKIPKVLEALIKGENALLASLQHIQTASAPADLANYHFELQDCVDRTTDSLQNAEDARNGK